MVIDYCFQLSIFQSSINGLEFCDRINGTVFLEAQKGAETSSVYFYA
jgi:hypothetical protein